MGTGHPAAEEGISAGKLRAKVRTRVKRREDQVEEEEVEGGEINLIPYLDIVTNLMLFLLSISSGFLLGQIDTTLPDHARAGSKPAIDPAKEPAIQLIASITDRNILLWSISGLEGTLMAPKAVIERAPAPSAAPAYDYDKFNAALVEIAQRRWGGKPRPKQTYEIILQADATIPYETVIAVMDHMRRALPPKGQPKPALENPDVLPDGSVREPALPYDAAKHHLFPDILFSSGFD